jgi:hypothetical protein
VRAAAVQLNSNGGKGRNLAEDNRRPQACAWPQMLEAHA